MSATLVAKDLSGGHAHRTLFESLDLTVAPGDVVGVVGANGAGKTTLLRLLAGADTTRSTAPCPRRPADAFVGWLPQEHERVPGETVARLRRPPHRGGRGDRRDGGDRRRRSASDAPGADDAYAVALDHWLASGAADLDDRIPPVLADLGLDVGPDALMTSLSGGQAARAALAALLLSRFDVVLLDEPTNDLDLDGLERLEAFVHGLRGGVVLVSHDREFLARCVTRIVELDLAQNQVAVYDGGYDAFLEERAVARRHAREAYEEFAENEGRPRRAGPHPARVELAGRAQRDEEEPRQRQDPPQGAASSPRRSRPRRSARWSPGSPGSTRSRSPARSGCCSSASAPRPARARWSRPSTRRPLRRGDFVLGPVSLQVNAGDRIGITGPNGAGKTTLLRLLLGDEPPDEGTRQPGRQSSRSARSTRPAPACAEDLPARRRLRGGGAGDDAGRGAHAAREVRPQGRPGLEPGRRGSPPASAPAPALALLQARGVNLLVLDEPTNHLDLPAIEQLEQALDVVRRRAAAGLPRPAAARQRPPRRSGGTSRPAVVSVL